MKWFAVLVASLCVAGSFTKAYAAPTSNGLYAVFSTTKGTFYCRLRYDLVPRTVANFVTLTEGNKDWLDFSKAQVVRRRFYNGLTFHRVVTNFVIQGGSPNGYGDDDPGYRFRDEFTNSLTHNKAGILSMANSGPDSNGSQFFVTLSATPWLDGVHSVFGSVTEGMNVVTNINRVATDANSKPLIPIFMTNVSILRIGTTASNFNAISVSSTLPSPRPKTSRIYFSGPDLYLTWTPVANYEDRFCLTSDLKQWDGGYWPSPPVNLNGIRTDYQYLFFTVFESKID